MIEVIENLYTTFAKYKLSEDFVGCNDCFHAEASVFLAEASLRDLTIGDLEPYSSKAMSTWSMESSPTHFGIHLGPLMQRAYDGFNQTRPSII
ncbi:hypothetical protein [Bremerella alba]|uniref:Uncharacterized protein n=1 Tax=Bremerella alba TaxID=980252 RepID=A0A7V8V7N2_9BACT|nr:hypothetical protein [Bremerella alba]MBA2116463.1 hypothetical protein [Bremerella alba]